MKNPKLIFVLPVILCLIPGLISSSMALLLGLIFTFIFNNPFKDQTSIWGGYLLKSAVIGLGFGVNLTVLFDASKDNFWSTAFFVISAIVLGLIIGKAFKVDKKIALLISAGTAICGGSAIAAVGSVIKADVNQLSLSTGVVFVLNAFAIVLFPFIGQFLELSQIQFGTWAAIAIHDMSSVVGAATKFGDESLQIATITKMLRVIWIIPLSLGLVLGLKENRESFKIPTFIIGFIFCSFLLSFLPRFFTIYSFLYLVSKQLMILSLFLIGTSFSIENIKKLGKPIFMQATLVWVLISLVSLVYVIRFK